MLMLWAVSLVSVGRRWSSASWMDEPNGLRGKTTRNSIRLFLDVCLFIKHQLLGIIITACQHLTNKSS